MGVGGSSFWLVPGTIPGASSGAIGVSTRTLGWWLVPSIGAHLSRAFGVAPKFASSPTSGFEIRPRVLVVTSNVRAFLILHIVI